MIATNLFRLVLINDPLLGFHIFQSDLLNLKLSVTFVGHWHRWQVNAAIPAGVWRKLLKNHLVPWHGVVILKC